VPNAGAVLNAGAKEWVRYRRVPSLGVEVLGAHFEAHVYDRHSHDAYSFGVTEQGAQWFRCRGAAHVSRSGLVMAFNPDEFHDGHADSAAGFTYQMIYLDPGTVRDVLAEADRSRAGLPLFADPVINDRAVAGRVRRAARAVLADAEPLATQEALDALIVTATGRYGGGRTSAMPVRRSAGPADTVREILRQRYAEQVTADELAHAVGVSRFQLYRLFHDRFGLAPSGYLRELRLRAARTRLAAGDPPARVAAAVGFADQAHLTRWFRRVYGITPAMFQSGAAQRGLTLT
jgi:AraC-like DNA-binding protein